MRHNQVHLEFEHLRRNRESYRWYIEPLFDCIDWYKQHHRNSSWYNIGLLFDNHEHKPCLGLYKLFYGVDTGHYNFGEMTKFSDFSLISSSSVIINKTYAQPYGSNSISEAFSIAFDQIKLAKKGLNFFKIILFKQCYYDKFLNDADGYLLIVKYYS